jgi:hypothetical protein
VADEVREALRLHEVLANHEVLREALLVPIASLRNRQAISRDAARELAFVQATVYAALMVDDEKLLNQLSGEIRDLGGGDSGLLPLQQHISEVATAAAMLQKRWRSRRTAKLLLSVFSGVAAMSAEQRASLHLHVAPPATCLVCASIAPTEGATACARRCVCTSMRAARALTPARLPLRALQSARSTWT